MRISGWSSDLCSSDLPINSLSDLNGLKLRAPGGYGKFVAQFGAQPVTMAFGETYTALATGVIAGCASSNLIDYRDGQRSAERCVGKECVRKCCTRWYA